MADLDTVGCPGFALKFGFNTGHNPQKSGFSRPVETHNPDFNARKKRQANITQHLLAAGKSLGQIIHNVNILIGGHLSSGLDEISRYGAI